MELAINEKKLAMDSRDIAKERFREFLLQYSDAEHVDKFIDVMDKVFTKKETPGFVYIVYDKNTKQVKIGKTKNITTRMKTLSLSNLSLCLYGYMKCKDYSKAENFLHHYFKSTRTQREWFAVDPKIVLKKLISMQNKYGYGETNSVCIDTTEIVANAKKQRRSACWKNFMNQNNKFMGFWERTNSLIKQLNKTQRGLALECGFTERRIETLSSNNRSPDVIEAVKIAAVLNTTVEFLVMGKGE